MALRITASNTILITTLVVFIFVPKPDYLNSSSLVSAATHHLWHANWAHLAANCIAIYFALLPKRRPADIPLAWLFGSISFFFASGPVIGASNFLFSLAGLSAGGYGRDYWRNPASWVFVIMMIGMLAFPKISATTHIVSFALGITYGGIRRIVLKINRDYERIYRR